MRPFGLPPWIALLGFGGLLPPLALIVLGQLGGPAAHSIEFWGVVYGGLILTFLGGTWWAFASRFPPRKLPTGILILSVMPSLIVFALMVMLFSFAALSPFIAGLIVGGLILFSPLVDAWIARRRYTPRWWMTLRVPLSIILAALTIACGWLA
ncbi:DUF3429 domain-containing protein [Sphingomicrobium sp. XHP0239]|uniref:DUF3429 domain-containing protein n=1 Tax=Sphingomicrobium maritimum TaxID=3133972 RepID=UPI0031CC7251